MQLTRTSWQWIVIPVLVACLLGVTAGTAVADDDTSTATVQVESPFDLPDFEAGDQLPVMSTGNVPWLSQEETYFHADKSVYWNSNFRGGMGQIRINAAEYTTYNYNNKTLGGTVDPGEIREIHHTITLMGAPVPMFRLYATFGINTISIERGNDADEIFDNLSGITYELGVEFGVPIVELLVIEARFFWRRFEASKGSGTDYHAIGTQWNGSLVVTFEPIGERLGFTLNVYAGIGYHYNYQRWIFASGTSNDITPDNSSTQTNGPERFDIIAGVNVMPVEWFSINIEARFVGPFHLVGSFSFIF